MISWQTLPKGWNLLALNQICDLQNGYAFKSNDYVNVSNTLNCRMSNIRPNGFFDLEHNQRFLPDSYTEKYQQYLLKDGDVIIAMTDMATEAKILGVPTIVETQGKNLLLNQRVGKLIIKKPELIYFPYLKYALNREQVKKYFLKFAGGGLQINLGKDDILSVEIPLPPLVEQKRIAEILDRAEELRSKRREAIAKLDTLTQSIFLEIFGDPATNSHDLDRRSLGEICEIISPLVDPTLTEYENLLHISPDRIEKDTGRLLPAKTAKEDGVTSVKFLFESECILYSKIRPYLNKVALATQRGLCSADMYPVTACSDIAVREFILYLLLNNDFLEYAATLSNRSNIPKINRQQFLAYPAICPPLPLQKEFAQRVEAVEKLKATHHASLSELEALFASLQHRAFRGEL